MNTRTKTKRRPKLETLEARRLLSVYADFNGDGFDDLAIGVHGENSISGAVSVIYGSATGLSATGTLADQSWSQNSTGIADASESNDQFGRVLAAGDFNSDGFADLAIGVPFEDGTTQDSGIVHTLYGSAAGLTATGSQLWHQGLIGETNEPGDRFGGSLAVGDFNNDGFFDLAIGRPGETAEGIFDVTNVGAADVIYGSASGLTATGNVLVDCDVGGVIDDNDQFAASLAAGDFDNDGFSDLAIGVSGYQQGSGNNEHGAVMLVYGEFDGFLCDNSGIDQDTPGIAGGTEDFDRFGFSLATGDFDGDNVSDLAIGVPFEDHSTFANAGGVHVLYGVNGQGLSTTSSQFWTQDALLEVPEASDLFGVAIVAGDFNGDSYDELAIGVSREDLAAGVIDAGALNLIFGGPSGLTLTGNQVYHQDTIGIEDTGESNDQFSFALAANDFNGDGRADLAVGVIQENDSGAVHVLYGNAAGFSTANDQVWTQNSSGIEDTAEANDFFGVAFPGGSGIGNAGFSGEWVEVTWTTNGSGTKGKLKGTLAVTNPGLEVAAASVVRFYLSDDPRFNDTDLFLDEAKLDLLLSNQTVNVKLKAKLNNGQTATGKYVIAVLDADNTVTELNEDNNIIVYGPIAERSSPFGNPRHEDFAYLVTADFDTPINKLNKRRNLSGHSTGPVNSTMDDLVGSGHVDSAT